CRERRDFLDPEHGVSLVLGMNQRIAPTVGAGRLPAGNPELPEAARGSLVSAGAVVTWPPWVAPENERASARGLFFSRSLSLRSPRFSFSGAPSLTASHPSAEPMRAR